MDLDTTISPTMAFGFMIVLMLSVAIVCICRGMKNKNNIFYKVSGLFCFMAFSFLVGVLGQNLLCLILLGISVVAGLFMVPKIMQINTGEFEKAQETIDGSEPIRFKDLFSSSFILKLERKHGERKAIIIFCVTSTVFVIPMLFAMVLLHIITWPIAVGASPSGFILWLFMYRRMKKGL
ncbi:MAG: hypothetical protein LBQ98_08625 [Nitrososphaerota archaeon]|jgi:hypothetical protein|nr:hypothetical protein [Nitrososphaerota archaeon]